MKPILIACESLGGYMGGVLQEMACDSVLPPTPPSELGHLAPCLRMSCLGALLVHVWAVRMNASTKRAEPSYD